MPIQQTRWSPAQKETAIELFIVNGGNYFKTARELGMSRSTLYTIVDKAKFVQKVTKAHNNKVVRDGWNAIHEAIKLARQAIKGKRVIADNGKRKLVKDCHIPLRELTSFIAQMHPIVTAAAIEIDRAPERPPGRPPASPNIKREYSLETRQTFSEIEAMDIGSPQPDPFIPPTPSPQDTPETPPERPTQPFEAIPLPDGGRLPDLVEANE